MINQPLASILRIGLEPGAGIAEAKTVSPCVHVGYQPISTDSFQLVTENNLQIANRGLLELIATRIGLKLRATLACHANDVTGFVQQRVDGRVGTNKDVMTDHPGLTISPKAACYGLAIRPYSQLQSVATQQRLE
jgi:hypothetical protein